MNKTLSVLTMLAALSSPISAQHGDRVYTAEQNSNTVYAFRPGIRQRLAARSFLQ